MKRVLSLYHVNSVIILRTGAVFGESIICVTCAQCCVCMLKKILQYVQRESWDLAKVFRYRLVTGGLKDTVAQTFRVIIKNCDSLEPVGCAQRELELL